MRHIFVDKKFEFGTKAETLTRLSSIVRASSVPPLYSFSVSQWQDDPKRILEEIGGIFNGARLAVRSSATSEDGPDSARAGEFSSILNVDVGDEKRLIEAIDEVASSYLKDVDSVQGDHGILVQRMVTSVSLSGVVFTQDLNSGAPYYVINYDDNTGRTDSVTSGTGASHTIYLHRDADSMLHSERIKTILDAVKEIEELTDCDHIDIEFAVDTDNVFHLLQVRKITTQANWNRGLALRVDDALRRMESLAAQSFRECPGVYGRRSVFGQMPDWNPAEMIGTAPRPLAASLYRYLITDRIWRVAREQMGYAEPKGHPLMTLFGGQPYIDARLSFHSYIPNDLAPEIAHKLVSAWLDRLVENPEFHDKIEFEVAITVLAFDFDERFELLCADAVLSDDEREAFRSSLQRLTASLLEGRVASIDSELAKVELLREHIEVIEANAGLSDLRSAWSLLEDCIERGTIPFSILARHGFIAQTLLNSLVSAGALSAEDVSLFLGTIETVASQFVVDIGRVATEDMTGEEFMELYGHLRPGTYDIQSMRYDQRLDFLHSMSPSAAGTAKPETPEFSLTEDKEKAVQDLLDSHNYRLRAPELFEYMRKAIQAREYAKFMFTRNISDALEIIAVWGERNNLSREELSYIPIQRLLDTVNTTHGRDLEEHLRGLADEGKREHEVSQALRLPSLIHEVNDFYVIPLRICRPNFITQKSVDGRASYITSEVQSPEIKDTIVLIENADPGYDWIFAVGIKGLITKFGGANSHMSIRCAEFGIPAAIGCGEQIFNLVRSSKHILLDCDSGRIEPLAR